MKPEIDSHKLMFHPERVAEWEKNGDCFPIYVEVGTTNRCNHQCTFCALDYLEKGGHEIETGMLLENLEDMAEHGIKSMMFAGEGEPLMHKNINWFVRHANGLGIDVSITTNGSLLDKDKADEILPYLTWLRFSINAGTPETYSKVHKVSEREFNKVLDNLRYAVELKKINGDIVNIGVQALLIAPNINEALHLAEIVKQIGADNIQLKPYSHHPKCNNDLSFDYNQTKELGEAVKKLETEKFKVFYRSGTIKRLEEGATYTECHGLPFFALIDARGNVIPCNLYYNSPEFTYGNLHEKKFSEIWTGEKRKEVLKKLREKGVEGCRAGCRLDTINKYLHRLKNPYPFDNFI